ncbi:11044_t:CDS:2, partial [Diversispora eburnea]
KHSLSFLKINKSTSSSNQYNNSNNSFSNYKSFSNSTTHPQITVTTTTNSHVTYTNTSSNSYYTHHRNHNSSSSFNPSIIRTTSAMMIYYDTKTNSQIPQEMIQSLEKICGESIFNTLIKTQICYVHEDLGSVWNLDNFENAGRYSIDVASERRSRTFDVNHVNHNKIGKIFGGAGGNKFEDNETGRYSIDVVRNGDVRGYVSFNSRVGNSDNGSNKENNGHNPKYFSFLVIPLLLPLPLYKNYNPH